MPSFTDRLRIARTNKGLTHQDVAEKAGHGRTWYTKIENEDSKPNWADMTEVGMAIGISLDHLAYGGAPVDPMMWARFQHLPPEYQAVVERLIDTLYDREVLQRVTGKEG